jgi:hypothetical protein
MTYGEYFEVVDKNDTSPYTRSYEILDKEESCLRIKEYFGRMFPGIEFTYHEN